MKKDEQLRVCVHDCMRDKVCKHVYAFVSIRAHKTAVVYCVFCRLLTDQLHFTQTQMPTNIQCLAQDDPVLLKV